MTQIFEDGVVEVKERDALQAACNELGLAQDQILEVFTAFLDKMWGQAMADDVLTPSERLVLKRVIKELRIPDDRLPVQARLALRDV
ncbi:MAG TPA: hypothetical protein VK116_16720 [Planctomycetota bacterium]|nr:hypothetical protein [Planctomycetota bacterium]